MFKFRVTNLEAAMLEMQAVEYYFYVDETTISLVYNPDAIECRNSGNLRRVQRDCYVWH